MLTDASGFRLPASSFWLPGFRLRPPIIQLPTPNCQLPTPAPPRRSSTPDAPSPLPTAQATLTAQVSTPNSQTPSPKGGLHRLDRSREFRALPREAEPDVTLTVCAKINAWHTTNARPGYEVLCHLPRHGITLVPR